MKRLCYLLLALSVVIGCNKIPNNSSDLVNVSFCYVIPQSGSMTKVTPAEVYDSFFETYIKTGQLLPKPYSLIIKTLDDVEVARVAGRWGENNPVTLSTGKYKVTGESSGGINYSDKYKTAPLIFDETIEITENTSSVTLHAIYDCFLVLFDAEGKTRFQWSADGSGSSGISGDVPTAGNYYYFFAQGFSANGNVQWQCNGKDNRIWMAQFNFQKGYYYYYNDLAGSFEVPKMQAGSI